MKFELRWHLPRGLLFGISWDHHHWRHHRRRRSGVRATRTPKATPTFSKMLQGLASGWQYGAGAANATINLSELQGWSAPDPVAIQRAKDALAERFCCDPIGTWLERSPADETFGEWAMREEL